MRMGPSCDLLRQIAGDLRQQSNELIEHSQELKLIRGQLSDDYAAVESRLRRSVRRLYELNALPSLKARSRAAASGQ